MLLLLILLQTAPVNPHTEEETQCKYLASYYTTMGIMTEEEKTSNFFFAYPWSLKTDVNWMNWRMEQMEVDCPPLSDLDRFPCKFTASMNWRKTVRYKKYLEERLDYNIWPAHQLQLELHLKDAEWRYNIWDAVDNIHTYNCLEGKRLRLQKLRKVLGRENYEKGILPPPLSEAALNSAWYKFDLGLEW